MDPRCGRPLLRLPFCPSRIVDTGVVSDDGEGVGPRESRPLWLFKVPLATSLLSLGVTWIFGTSGSFELMMMWTCSSPTSGLERDGGRCVSGVPSAFILL